MNVLFLIMFWMTTLAPGRDHQLMATIIADEILSVRPLVVDDDSREKTAARVIALTFRESSFRNDAKSKTDDHCIAQIHGRPDLAKDLRKCVRTAIAMLRESIAACGPNNELGVYATGSCVSARGKRISRDRMELTRHLLGIGAAQ